jgi:hypothetical protein
MTLLDIRNQIVRLLCNKDTFGTEDFESIRVPEELADKRDHLIRSAAKQLVAYELLVDAGTDFWVLSSPLNGGGQELHISMQTANEIADTINTFLDANDLDLPPADALGIHEGNIIMLLSIVNDIISDDFEPETN